MRVCLATYGDRLAALLENAGELRLFEVAGDRAEPTNVLPAPRGDPEAMVLALIRSGADVVVCGAVCGRLRLRLVHGGPRVVAWVAGSTAEVLRAFLENRLETCAMPGCGGGRCGRRRRAGKEST